MASFQSAAEAPDRDDEEEHPDVDCGHCGAYLGTHPCDDYVDCGECGGATLSRWAPEAADPSDEDIARRDAAWSEATLREHAESARTGEADAAIDRILMARGAGRTVPMVRADRLAAMEVDRDAQRAIVEGRTTAPTDADLDAHAKAGGMWLSVGVSAGGGVGGVVTTSLTRQRRDTALAPLRWWPMTAGGVFCAWPKVAA